MGLEQFDGIEGHTKFSVARVSQAEYKEKVKNTQVFFNRPEFAELNAIKVDEVMYLIISKGESARFGIILGRVGDEVKCPFSAPYGYPVEIKDNMKIDSYENALWALEKFCIEQGIHKISFTFPPLFYNEHGLSAWINVFYRNLYSVSNVDINYILDLEKLNTDDYEQLIGVKARKHLRKAVRSGMTVLECTTGDEFEKAYSIVKLNHDAKNRPTRMTLQQIKDTVRLTDYKAFIAKLDGQDIASMIYYRINDKVVQCIYSGILPNYENSGAMNLLSWYAIRFFGNQGYSIIDRATATEDSIPNHGLCDFKESIGATRCLKYTFAKELH